MRFRRVIALSLVLLVILGLAVALALMDGGEEPTGGRAGATEVTTDRAGDQEEAEVLLPIETVPVETGATTDSLPEEEARSSLFKLLPKGVEVSKASPSSARVWGRWTDARGAVVAYRRVRILRINDAGETAAQIVVATGQDGTYSAHVLPGTCRVAFDGEAHEITLAPREEHRLDHVSSGRCEVHVTIKGKGTQPHNNRIILSRSGPDGVRQRLEARTDRKGVATFSGVRAGQAMLEGALVRPAGGRPIRVVASMEIPKEGVVEVTLRPPLGRLFMRVVDKSDGAPIPGVHVELFLHRDTVPRGSAVTSELGAARIDRIATGAAIVLLRHPEFAPRSVSIEIAEGSAMRVLELDRGISLSARATDDEDRPMHIILRARSMGEARPRNWEWRLDKEGRFEMSGLPREPVKLEFIASGCEPLRLSTHDVDMRSELRLRFKRLAPSK